MVAMSKITAEDLRAAVARSDQYIYIIAARARMHPMTLSRLLHGHIRITDRVASRILLAVEQEVAAKRPARSHA
jgi:hypothetical protein